MPTPDERTAAFNRERLAQMRRLVRIQRDTIAEILRQLEKARKTITARLAGVTDTLKRTRLEATQREIDAALQAFSTAARTTSLEGAQQAWDAGIDLIRVPLAAGGLAFEPRINPRALTALRTALTHYLSDASTSAINRINGALAQVLIGTLSTSDAISAVQKILDATRSRARTIVYTELGRIYSAANQASMEDAATRLPGLRKRWNRSGKLHPRPDHVAAHGQLRKVSEPFDIAGEQLMYPRDPNGSASNTINCGCLSIPVTDGSTWGASTTRLDPLDADGEVTREPRVPAGAAEAIVGAAEEGVVAAALAAAVLPWERAALRGLPDTLARALVPLERGMITRPVEWAYVLDDSGKTIWFAEGRRDRVLLDQLSTQDARGKVFTHAHLDALPPSMQDIFAAVGYGFAELRVAAAGVRYRILPPISGWKLGALLDQELDLARYARNVETALREAGVPESEYPERVAASLLDELVRRGLIRLETYRAP
jgi:hypothetical protein